jgi:hypothetical protein
MMIGPKDCYTAIWKLSRLTGVGLFIVAIASVTAWKDVSAEAYSDGIIQAKIILVNKTSGAGNSDVQAIGGTRLRAIGGTRLRSDDDSNTQAIGGTRLRADDDSQTAAIGGTRLRAIGGTRLRSDDDSNTQAIGGTRLRAIGGTRLRADDDSQTAAIGGTRLRAIGGTRLRAIGGTRLRQECSESEARAIGGTRLRAIGGTRLRSDDDSNTQAIGGTRLRAIGGTRLRAIGGTRLRSDDDSNTQAIGGTRLRAIGGTRLRSDGPDLESTPEPGTVVGPVESYDPDTGVLRVLNRSVELESGLSDSSLSVGNIVAILDCGSEPQTTSVAFSYEDYFIAGVSEVIISGEVASVSPETATFTVNNYRIDYSQLLSELDTAPAIDPGTHVVIRGVLYPL